MSLPRKLLVITLLFCAPFLSAANGIGLVSVAGPGEHEHRMSLASENGELHALFHHDDQSAGRGGDELDAADHDVHLRDGAAVITALRPRDARPTPVLMASAVRRSVSVYGIAIAAPRSETPPFPRLITSIAVLRI